MGEQTDNTQTYCVLASKRAKLSPRQAHVEGSRGEEEPKKHKKQTQTLAAWGMCLIMHGIPKSGSVAFPR
jgi:hypothetical protein